jgi:alkanesulfonate monooxygenase SsuD/methylene tetrahydromethanopterin reductase-like flavin-dependent oxidoreductase (luciferase family)
MSAPRRRPLKVGLFLPTFENPFTRSTPSWNELRAIAKCSEDAGFDSLNLGDHLLMRFDPDDPMGVWEGGSMIAAIAATTRNIQIGLLMACTAYRNPGLLAKMATTVDEISDGRLTLGLGAGWHEPEFLAFGYPFDHRVDRFEEAVVIITTLVRKGRIDFDGTHHQMRECELLPHGPRPEGLPIAIGAKGPRMLELAARHADIWNRDFFPESAISDLPVWRARVDAACQAVNRDPATLERTAAVAIDLPGGTPREGWNALTGTPEDLAESLRAYANAGISHVQIWLEPSTLAGIEVFAPTLEILDR